MNKKKPNLLELRHALEASWKPDTAYLEVSENGNPALGQCYPTSRVVQIFFPEMEIVEGEIWAGKQTEKHFWNVLVVGGEEYHIDLTWQQFPHGSSIKSYRIRDRESLGDGEETIHRVERLLKRVNAFLSDN